MSKPSEKKQEEWRLRAAAKGAIVPYFFEVFPHKVIIQCGACKAQFQRTLIPRLNEPTFICPQDSCKARNWVPVTFDLDS